MPTALMAPRADIERESRLPLAERRLVATAVHGVESLYAPGHRYTKAGVRRLAVTPRDVQQGDVFADVASECDRRLMATLDRINATVGVGTRRLAREGVRQLWAMR